MDEGRNGESYKGIKVWMKGWREGGIEGVIKARNSIGNK